MTADPFQTPRAPIERSTMPGSFGRMDVGRALGDGWELMKANFGTWLGAAVVTGLLCAIAGVLLFIPLLIVGPAMVWGFTRYQLEAWEGRGELSNIWEGFSNLGPALIGFLVYFIATLILSAVPQGIATAGQEAGMPILQIVGGLLSIVVSLISLRWIFAGFFIVEHRMNGIDAIRASWRATQGQWLTLFLFGIAAFFVSLLGLLAFVVGILPASAVITFAYVALYRQLTGPAPQSAAAFR